METINEEKRVHLPRWEELPNIDLYMDQVLSLTDQYLTPISIKPMTAAMINNYVKLKLLPKPQGKRYTRLHVAFIFAIAILKDVFEISQIKEGIVMETQRLGLKHAYNDFISEVEEAISLVNEIHFNTSSFRLVNEGNHQIMKYAALSFATQRRVIRLIQLEKEKKGEQKND